MIDYRRMIASRRRGIRGMTRKLISGMLFRINNQREHILHRSRFLRKPIMRVRHPWNYISRKRAISTFETSDRVRQYVEELRHTGSSVVTPVADRDLLHEAYRDAQSRLHSSTESSKHGSKDYWEELVKPGALTVDSIFTRLSLQQSVLNIVSLYLGEIPYLCSIELIASRGSDDTNWKRSQRWHRDYNDSRMVKLFTFLTDVKDDEDGPLTFIPANYCQDVSAKRFPIHKTDNEIARLGLASHVTRLLCPSKTSVLLDTHRCFHRGSRMAPGRVRIALISTYVSSASYFAYDNQIAFGVNLSSLHKLVLRG